MRTLIVLAVSAALAAACTLNTEPLGRPADGDGGGGVYATKAELDALAAKVAFLDGCKEGDVLVREAAGFSCQAEPPCPPGFSAASEDAFTVCTRTVRGGINDVLVKVGDFWIDRYEMSACPGGSLGTGPANDTTAVACSTTGGMPQASITWFQAQAMCANAGKHLCTNAEWQAAVSGTADPGAASGTDGKCVTMAGGPRMTGMATMCRSRFGAEDMIGNVWEWVADWEQAGRSWQTADGQNPTPRSGVTSGPWPVGYQNDQTWNVDGTANDGDWQQGLPAAALRGGAWNNGTEAGAFALSLYDGPSAVFSHVGARCCAGVR